MDVTFTVKFDVKQYARDIKRALAFLFRNLIVFYWCLLAAWLVIMFALWLEEWPEGWETLAWPVPFLVVCVGICRRFMVFAYVRQVQRMIGNDAPMSCRMTDNGYETVCGDLVQKLPWQKIATCYHFLDDDTVSFMLKRVGVVMVLSDLRKCCARRDCCQPSGQRYCDRSVGNRLLCVVSVSYTRWYANGNLFVAPWFILLLLCIDLWHSHTHESRTSVGEMVRQNRNIVLFLLGNLLPFVYCITHVGL